MKVKLSKKGQIAIPKAFRDKLNTDILDMEMKDGQVILKPVESVLKQAGIFKKYAEKADHKNENNVWGDYAEKKYSGH